MKNVKNGSVPTNLEHQTNRERNSFVVQSFDDFATHDSANLSLVSPLPPVQIRIAYSYCYASNYPRAAQVSLATGKRGKTEKSLTEK